LPARKLFEKKRRHGILKNRIRKYRETTSFNITLSEQKVPEMERGKKPEGENSAKTHLGIVNQKLLEGVRRKGGGGGGYMERHLPWIAGRMGGKG